MKKTLMAGLFALTTAASCVALAMPGMDGDKGRYHERHMERIATELELTTEQQEQLRAVHEEQFEKMKALHDERKEKVDAILTDEQRQKMQQMREEKREKMKKHMEERKERKSDKRDDTRSDAS
ncbi:hypothetical protein [Halopseudomonas bauzanensis]|uniref:Periplasmic heavy metal sensor n=1 Tax=Halopseudomonas bauzanensis TaxID=653930 RepID=A0A1H9VEX8_9GAMM|nr:hypothetical protein [Halopseudomonas bauzanensis]SES20119.1 hypothetical protein SAMN05216589_2681 [Halopseudomonas bauzanensis]SFM15869.1 hypothetical protein SAMN04487855_2539 [Halopseudomonas bauzanensis]